MENWPQNVCQIFYGYSVLMLMLFNETVNGTVIVASVKPKPLKFNRIQSARNLVQMAME